MNHVPRIPEERGLGERPWLPAPGLGTVTDLVHGFTVRKAGDFSMGPPEGWPASAGAHELRLLEQVHGHRIAPADEPGDLPRADGWAGRPPPGVLLGIRTADCLAVLLVHPPSQTLALAHAGWRGATGGVVENALAAMACPPDQIWGSLGPAIGPCCYQVGPEVAEAAGPGDHVTPWPRVSDRYRLDLQGLVASRLGEAGVRLDRVGRVPWCTSCHPDRFYSHRRAGETGRLCAFLGWVDR